MSTARIPVEDYRSFARQFNPTNFNAEAWAQLAQDAGMKYIVFTAKHHDGFAMFDSKVSDWNIVKATPFGRDPIRELAVACEKRGIKLGFYYSHVQDWVNPGGAEKHGSWDPAQRGSFEDYLDKIAVPQVRELLTNYGDVGLLWWDTPLDIQPEHAKRFVETFKLQPGLLSNDRLGGGYL
jgi:alpha-L-fucosidase